MARKTKAVKPEQTDKFWCRNIQGHQAVEAVQLHWHNIYEIGSTNKGITTSLAQYI